MAAGDFVDWALQSRNGLTATGPQSMVSRHGDLAARES